MALSKTNKTGGALLSMLLCLSTLFLAGCGGSSSNEASYPTPDDFSPEYYASEEEVPDSTYCIVHEEDGKTLYYPLYAAESTIEDVQGSASGADATRLWWVNYNVDEGLIPTMYGDAGDYIIYKSAGVMTLTFALEKFYDEGYTIGICGLQKDSSGHYQYSIDNGGYVLTTGDAAGLDAVEADNIFLAYIDGEKVTGSMVSESGTILGLELMQSYECDVRFGTVSNIVSLVANAHYFTSAETYILGEFDFISEYVARVDMPEYAGTGYYGLNGAGYFRYVAEGSDYHGLEAKDYNNTIFAYDENGNISGTNCGYGLDENGYLVEAELLETETEEEYTPDYSYMEDVTEAVEAVEAGGTETLEEDETENMVEVLETTDGTESIAKEDMEWVETSTEEKAGTEAEENE